MPEAEDPEKQYEAEIAAEVSRSFVKVPADPLRASKPCPICKEKFKQQFNEQQEDFVWRDAKMVDGVVSRFNAFSLPVSQPDGIAQVYHASCYLEMKKARASSKKAKTEGGPPSLTNSAPPSRECTPQLPFGSTSSSQEQSGITFTASPSQKNVPVKVEESEPSIPPQPTANGSNDSEVKPPEAQQHAPAAAPLSLDSNLLAHLANIVSRSNTPQTQEVPAQANEVHQSSPHSRKRSVEVLQTTQSNSADDNSMPEAKRVKQEEGVDEDETLYGVSAHPH